MKSPYLVDVKREQRIRAVSRFNGLLFIAASPLLLAIGFGQGEYLLGGLMAAFFFVVGVWSCRSRRPLA